MLIRILAILLTTSYLLLANPIYAADPNPCNVPSPDPTQLAEYKAKYGPCPGGLNEIENIFSSLISVIVSLGFIVMLVFIVMAGFKYLTSGGEPKALQSAHHALVWAVLGVVFMAIAWLILQLISNFTGINVTVFDVKSLCGDPNGATKWFCPSPAPLPGP